MTMVGFFKMLNFFIYTFFYKQDISTPPITMIT